MKTFGVLGLGSIGSRHAVNLLGLGHDVKGFDTDPSRVLAVRDIKTLSMEDIPNVDALIIATPTALHAKGLRLALKNNKHAFVEKPISDKPLIKGDYNTKLTVAVGNNMRYHPAVQFAKEWLLTAGKVYWADFCVAQYNKKYSDDVVTNWGAHEIDLSRYLLGEATVVGAAGDGQTMHATLLHGKRGCCSAILLCYRTSPEVRGFTIAAEAGVLHANLVNHAVGCAGDEHKEFKDDVINKTYIHEMQDFIKVMNGHSSSILATAEDGLATLELILKIKELSGAVGQGSVRSGVAS